MSSPFEAASHEVTPVSTIISTPTDVLALWAQAWAVRDADALAALFADDAEFVNVVGLWWHDSAAIRTAHAYGFEVIFGDSDFEFTRHRVRSVGPDCAVVHAKWRLTGQYTPTGQDTSARYGIFTFVLERTTDRWLVVAAQNTDIIAGAESIAVVDGSSVPTDYR